MNRALVVIGIAVLLAGRFWKQLAALPLFRLPGDIVIGRPGFRVVSALPWLLVWLFRK